MSSTPARTFTLRSRSRARSAVLAVGTVLALGACQDAPTPPSASAPVAGPRLSIAVVASDETPSQQDVASAVSGFGGYYIDPAGAPTVWLMDPSQRSAAAAALAGFLRSYGWSAADLRVREAQYDYLQLAQWYEAARPRALGVNGAVYGDIDEANNRLTFAGVDAGALASIGGIVSAAGVPAAAVRLVTRGPVRQLATLRDRFRPPFGGLQINFFPTPAAPVTLLCTLGFNAIDGTDTSFVTNSHCSNVQGGVAPLPTDYYQATRGGAVADPNLFVAREAEDPDYVSGGLAGPCPVGRRCRYSDASRAKYQPGQQFVLGLIARPANENATGTLDDTLRIDAVNPTFSITGEQASTVVGQRLSHVGRTTGWTSGLVTETCVDVSVTDSDITQLCQDLVDAYVAGGDSGSPVFGRYTDGTVFLAGLLWGSSTNLETNAVQFIMSPLGQVKAEIGNVKTFDPVTVTSKKRNKAPR